MFDFDEIEEDVQKQGGESWKESGANASKVDEDAFVKNSQAAAADIAAAVAAGPRTTPVPVSKPAAAPAAVAGPAFAHRRSGAPPIDIGKKVIIRGVSSEPSLNGKVGEVLGFEAGRYVVKVMNLGGAGAHVPGRAANSGEHMKSISGDHIELHPDQVEKDRQASEDGAVVLLGGDAAERAMRQALYGLRLDPQQLYDKAIERIFEARNEFAVLGLEPRWCGADLSPVKRAYRRASVSVHPDKNKHPQAVDAFRKVYGAFETLMDPKQQWRILFVLGRLDEDQVNLYDLEAEEDERFEWWLEANIPEIEKQAAEIEGGEFEEIGEKWISADGIGGDVNEVKWMGLSEGFRLRDSAGAIFIDCRERFEFELEHIEGAFNVPMREFIDFGLAGVAGDWVAAVTDPKRRGQPVVIYSEVATPVSRCRALARWLLRAGSRTIQPERLRRLRGGIFGWRQKRGKLKLALMDVTPEQKAEMQRALAKQIGTLTPSTPSGVNLRVRVQSLEERCPKHGVPAALLADSSGRARTLLRGLAAAHVEVLRAASKRQGSVLVHGASVVLDEGHLLLELGEDARAEANDREFTFGFEAKNISESVFVAEDDV